MKVHLLKRLMFVENVCQIDDHLYIGGHEAGTHYAYHKAKDFGLVINCTNDIPFVHPRFINTKYVKCAVNDNLKIREINKMTCQLPLMISLMRDTIKKNRSVLVYCRMGRQRSAIVVAAYLLTIGIANSPEEAIAIVKARKKYAFSPCVNFFDSLVAFSKTETQSL